MTISFARLCKAVSDRVLASIGLMLIAPVFLIVAILLKIRRESVFFRQKRIGQYGKPFEVYKFTTMFQGAEKKGTITTSSDPRVTLLGKFLRKYKINELPQLLNVLKGEMSVLGPRPLPQEEIDLYPPDVQAKIFTVKPGITGLATLRFIEEEALLDGVDDPEVYYVKFVLPRKGKLECYYVDHWSLLLDLRIFWKTLFKLFLCFLPIQTRSD
ncbi:sugar transferase [Candidatus Poribacteria bacterium]|nr:sugar transferase [Candidatus Poribacteria bacterium]